jgi:FAD synthetase
MGKTNKTRIMVFGTFDVLHKGHLNFFEQARLLANNPFLIVSIARDANVKRIKGRYPDFKEKQRLAEVKKSRLVNRATLGAAKDYLSHIVKEKPAIIAIGYDQKDYVNNLAKLLAKKGLKVKVSKLKAYKPQVYKSSLVKRLKKPKT